VFARALELTTRPGKVREVVRTLREGVMPTLNAQPGFVEHYILASDAEPDRVVVLTLWMQHEHAEWFYRRHYGKMRRKLEPLLEFEPVIRTFNVENGQAPAGRTSRVVSTRARPA
jgi:heme-degrading monooxygenase HmoA